MYPGDTVDKAYSCKKPLDSSVYHIWDWIKKGSERSGLSTPLGVILTEQGDLVSCHSNNRVYQWPIGTQSHKDKETAGEGLSLENVLILYHMQRTRDPFDENTGKKAKEVVTKLQNKLRKKPKKL